MGRQRYMRMLCLLLGIISAFTHYIEITGGTKHHYCFEYGLRETEGNYIELNQNSSYVMYQ